MGVSAEKYWVAPGALDWASAMIQGIEAVLAMVTSALCRATWRGSSPLTSAPTLPSHDFMASPRGNGCPSGRVVAITALRSPTLLPPVFHLARLVAAKGPVLNQA